MKQLLIVLANAVDGREAEFNEWYTYVHVRDVMRSRSAIAVQRFRLAAQQIEGRPLPEHRYLAMYEADDHAGLTEGHAEVFTPAMPISNAFRFDDMREAYYEPLAAIKGRSGVEGDGPVMVERIARSGAPADFERWYVDHRLPERARLAGISSAGLRSLPNTRCCHLPTMPTGWPSIASTIYRQPLPRGQRRMLAPRRHGNQDQALWRSMNRSCRA